MYTLLPHSPYLRVYCTLCNVLRTLLSAQAKMLSPVEVDDIDGNFLPS